MAESLILFESVINSRWFLRTSIILFLNKIDLFRAKLPRVPLEQYFPEYSGNSLILICFIFFHFFHLLNYKPLLTGGADVNKAAKYILWRFTQTNRARLNIYPQ